MTSRQLSGSEPTCPPPDPNPKRPNLKLPPASCNSHFHIFGPGSLFPYAQNRAFTPHDAPKEALLGLHRFLGFERGVFIQSACHGTDHSAVLDALATLKGRYRAVALLTPATPDAEIARLDAAGFCGVRFHLVSHLGRQPAVDDLRAIMRLVAPFDWHIAIHTMHHGIAEHFEFIASIRAPVVIDHIGRVDATAGPNGAAFTALRRLLDTGNVWVKLSGVDRISKQPPAFRDGVALARILAEQTPERILWGSDWPHPNTSGHMPNDGELVDLISQIAVTETVRKRLLVDNPAAFFGFD